MTVKQVSDLCLFPVRDAAKGFLISLRASNRYAPSYLEALERSLAFLASYADDQAWPAVHQLTTFHIETYLASLQSRTRWFGERDRKAAKPISQSYIETQYRRIKRFFGWLVERGHIDKNPLDLIPHPHIDEKVIQTVSEQEIGKLLALTNPEKARTPSERFRMIRDRAMLYLLFDTPGRRKELTALTIEDVDIDQAAILVMGKGRRERWMPLGTVAMEALWNYIQERAELQARPRHGSVSNPLAKTTALWVDSSGNGMRDPDWLRLMLKRMGERTGITNLHPHRFRHTYAVNALRAGMPERILALNGGWKKIPATYFRTLGAEDVARFHREMSPADRLGRGGPDQRKRGPGKARGRL